MRSTTAAPRSQAERAAAERIAAALTKAAAEGTATFGVCGGSSVGIILRRLAEDTDVPWERVHIFLVDERLVPLDDEESNCRLIDEVLLRPLRERSALPENNIHPFRTDEPRPEALRSYSGELNAHGGRFDVALLSAGEDGHVAALYPGHPALEAEEHFTVLEDSPKPPAARMTSSRRLLEASGAAFLLFFGEGKREALRRFREEPIDPTSCPAQLVLSVPEAHIFTDLEES